MLAELDARKWLESLAKCVRERTYVNGVRVFNGNMRMVFVRWGSISGGFCPTLENNDKIWM